MSARQKILRLIRVHPVDSAAFVVAAIALVLSIITMSRERTQHSDTLTSEVIRNAYSDFLLLDDLRAQYPMQSHIFETPENYERNKKLVVLAAAASLDSPAECARLALDEAALADRIMTMFEHSYDQWNHSQQTADTARVEFLKDVLDYFTGRILTNPRLRWYWSEKGANLSEHYEVGTISYYNEHVLPYSHRLDAEGPYLQTPRLPPPSRAKPVPQGANNKD